MPRANVGGKLTPGVRGFMLGGLMWLGAAPAGRNLWSNRKSPTFLGRVVSRADGGAELRFAVFRVGYPYRAREDPPALALFDEWLRSVGAELGAADGVGRDP
jgi:hypothetical protein